MYYAILIYLLIIAGYRDKRILYPTSTKEMVVIDSQPAVSAFLILKICVNIGCRMSAN